MVGDVREDANKRDFPAELYGIYQSYNTPIAYLHFY